MLRNRLLVCALMIVLLVPSVAFASFGIKGGMNDADLTGDDLDVDVETLRGRTLSLHFNMPMNRNFSFQPEFSYYEAGATMPSDFSVSGAGDEDDIDLRLTYIAVPVLLRFQPANMRPLAPFVFGGGYVAFNQEARFEFTPAVAGDTDQLDFDEIRKTDYGWVVGGGVQFGQFIVEARYSVGLVSIVDFDDSDDDDNDDTDVFNRAITLMVGVDFD